MSNSFSFGGADMSDIGLIVMHETGVDALGVPQTHEVIIPGLGACCYRGEDGARHGARHAALACELVVPSGSTMPACLDILTERLGGFEALALTVDCWPGFTADAVLEDAVDAEYKAGSDRVTAMTLKFLIPEDA